MEGEGVSRPPSRHSSGQSSGPASRHSSGGRRQHRGQHRQGAEEVRPQWCDLQLTPVSSQCGDAASVTPLVVRTSQSGIIPDTPGPLPEISGLIPDNADIDPSFKVTGVSSCMSNCQYSSLSPPIHC